MAQVKNFGLKGVASDVQFGKAGGRLVFDSTGGSGGTPAFAVSDASGVPVSLQGGAGVLDNEYVTVAQLNSVSAGIQVKSSVKVATQDDIVAAGAIYNAGGGPEGSGQLTGAPTSVDGVAVEAGDRILVRLEGIVFDAQGNVDSIDPVAAQRNGIYTVASDSVWNRAQDHDEDDEVTYGNYTFVTEGSTNEGQAFVLANILNSPIVANSPTLNSEPITFVLFSAAPTYEAADAGGLEVINGDEFRLDIDSLQSNVTSLNSTLAFGDGGLGGADSKQTVKGIFDTHNVVYGLADYSGGAGFVVRTGEDSYNIATLQASTDSALLGINVDEDLAGGGTISVGLDITGLSSIAATSADEIAFYDVSAGSNNKRTLESITQDLDIVRSNTIASGLITKISDDVYAGRSLLVDAGVNSGLNITNGSFVAGDAVIGLDFAVLGSKATPDLTDEFIINEVNGDGSNKRTSIQGFIDIVADNISDNEISANDSRVSVIDDGVGAGNIDVVVDSIEIAKFTNTKGNIKALEVADLGDTQVVVAGSLGRLTSSAGFTYNGLALSVTGDVTASGSIAGVNGIFSGNVNGVNGTFTGNVGAADGSFSGNVTAVDGDFSGDITGASLNTGTGTITGGNVTVADIDAANGTFTGDLSAVGADLTGQLTVGGGVSVTGGGTFGAGVTAPSFLGGTFTGSTITSTDLIDGRITFAGSGGQLIDSANLTFDGSNLTVSGDVNAGSFTTTGTVTAGDIDVASLKVSSLDQGRVVFAGVDGELVDSLDFTYNAGALSVTNSVTSGLFTGGAFDGSTVTASGAISGASLNVGLGSITGGAVTAVSADVSGNVTIGGTITTTGGSSALGYTAGTGGYKDSSLSGAGAIVFSDDNQRLVDDGAAFSYDTTTDTLTVGNLNVTGSLGLSVTEDELVFGTANGGVTSSSNFAIDDTNSTMKVGAIDIVGDTAGQSIVGNTIDGDISIVPNGAGEVIIGSAGAGVVASDSGQAMTVSGSSSLYLESGTGSVIVRDGGLEVAQFDANAGADTWLTFQSDLASNGVKIGASQDTDIKFVLGTGKLVKPDNASDYNATLAAGGAGTADAFVTKQFVEGQVQNANPVETYKSIVKDVDLSADGITNIDVSGGSTLPNNAVILRVKVQIVTTDAGATLTVGTSDNTNRYMDDFENDPQDPGIFVSELFDADGSAVQLVAQVANSNGDAGASAKVSIEYRVPVTV